MQPQPRLLLFLAVLGTIFVGIARGSLDHLTVRDDCTSPLEEPFSGLTLERQWTVARSDASQHFRDLRLRTFGRTFIDYSTESDAIDWHSGDLAKVGVYSNSTELLEIFETSPLKMDGIELRIKNEDAYVRGLVFTKILIREQTVLQSLELVGSTDVVVGDGVLGSSATDASDSSVSLVITGSGDLDVGLSSALEVDTLDLAIHGSGDIRINAPTLLISKAAQFSVSGSGDILIASESMTLAGLNIDVSGSGDVVVDATTLAPMGKCTKESIVVSGSGDVDTASVACSTASIELFGSGDIKFQAIDQLSVSVFGSGDLVYVNALPASVDISGPYSGKHLRSLLTQGKLSQKHRYRTDAISRFHSGNLAHFVIVRVVATSSSTGYPSLHIFSHDPNAWWVGNPYGSGLVSLTVLGSMDIDVLTIALGAGVVAGGVIYTLLQRRRRRRQGYAMLA